MSTAQGKCIIVSAPSGSGKTTIVKHVLAEVPALQFSVSATSRSPRSGEVEGRDYYFIAADAFRKKVEDGDFLEWEEVYPGQYYGTLKSEVERIWSEGNHVIFDLDVEGGARLKTHFGPKALAVFIQPPSVEELERRLRNRSTEDEKSLKVRVEKAKVELMYRPRFDLTVVNDNLEVAKKEAVEVVRQFLNYRA